MNRMLLYALLLAGSSATGADIYKCTDEEGNVAYLQTPCPVEKKPIAEESAETPIEAEIVDVVDDSQAAQAPEEVDACKEPFRDEVDAIYIALGDAYTPEQGEEFKKRLRTLTQQMRACG